MSLPQNVIIITRYNRVVFTVPIVLPLNILHPRCNYRGYRGITAFPITVSSSSIDTSFQLQLKPAIYEYMKRLKIHPS